MRKKIKTFHFYDLSFSEIQEQVVNFTAIHEKWVNVKSTIMKGLKTISTIVNEDNPGVGRKIDEIIDKAIPIINDIYAAVEGKMLKRILTKKDFRAEVRWIKKEVNNIVDKGIAEVRQLHPNAIIKVQQAAVGLYQTAFKVIDEIAEMLDVGEDG